jgi:hypothetical protein
LTSRKVTAAAMIAALFPGPGVILATALRTSPAEAFGADNVVTLPLACAQRAAIAAFVAQSLLRQADGTPRRLDDGPYPGSAFYATDQVYDLLHNCNRWTADALASAGLPVTAKGVVFANQVMGPVRALASDGNRASAWNSALSAPFAPCPS